MRLSRKNKIVYPDEMTCFQIERYRTLRFFEDLEKARDFAGKVNGQIYTQVDADGDILYSKGIRYVNRTGNYTVIKS